MMGEWYQSTRRICKCCGWSKSISRNFDSNFHNPEPCPRCGEYRFKTYYATKRDVFCGKWYNPLTWLDFIEEIKPGDWEQDAR